MPLPLQGTFPQPAGMSLLKKVSLPGRGAEIKLKRKEEQNEICTEARKVEEQV